MTAREASCPSCGTPLTFSNAATLVVVCESCGTAAYRTDFDLHTLGKAPEVAPIASVLSLGASGRLDGRAWRAIGQVQLDHGAGPWNEWCLHFDDGAWAWLAEAQGELVLTRPLEGGGTPPRPQDLRSGQEVVLGGERYVVVESRSARVTAVRGELPERTAPGDVRRYADLRGEGGRFATVSDDTSDAAPPEAYVGTVVLAEALGIDERTVVREAPRRAATDRFACPKCGAPVALRDPEGALRVTCGACASLLDRGERGFRVVQEAARIAAKPDLPLGARAKLRGLDVEVIAYLVRSVKVEGVRYAWDEYLLRTPKGAYRWLVQANGHWSFVEPLEAATPRAAGRSYDVGGKRFRHFQGGAATVDAVLGEMYWRCSVGETVHADDYVHVGDDGVAEQVSRERTDDEVVWSRSDHLPFEELRAAFGESVRYRVPKGVAPNQPNRARRAVRPFRRAWLAFVAVVVVLRVAFALHHADRVVLHQEFVAPPETAAAPAAETPEPAGRGVVFSEEFELEPAQANVEVRVHANVDNAWVTANGALVEVRTGEVHAFGVTVQRWHGVTGGESWSEGDRDETVTLGSVPAGRYALRVEAASGGEGAPPGGVACTATLRSQVPSWGRPLLLVVLLGVVPLLVWIASASFEHARWSESDHPGGGSD